ncbi:hypothetical protein RRG08_001732 [Elysia crispata]|uniref:Uncharacterized protein n=1 Tax=Elysia crispata TaxID=231223 RepID=A0AAE1E030_9GAST|nr:hypothetical protein RRG08_001732 [Elysia crispata]
MYIVSHTVLLCRFVEGNIPQESEHNGILGPAVFPLCWRHFITGHNDHGHLARSVTINLSLSSFTSRPGLTIDPVLASYHGTDFSKIMSGSSRPLSLRDLYPVISRVREGSASSRSAVSDLSGDSNLLIFCNECSTQVPCQLGSRNFVVSDSTLGLLVVTVVSSSAQEY